MKIKTTQIKKSKEFHTVVYANKNKVALAIRVDCDITGRVRAAIFYDMGYSHQPVVAPAFLRTGKVEICVQCNGTGKIRTKFPDLLDCHNCNGTGIEH